MTSPGACNFQHHALARVAPVQALYGGTCCSLSVKQRHLRAFWSMPTLCEQEMCRETSRPTGTRWGHEIIFCRENFAIVQFCYCVFRLNFHFQCK
uniref:Uncharacterized protein n=1 Tax=Rhipicephalus zambeziensis TaxID=60191 RepID=A0A224YHL8_9ACAR